MSLVPKWWQRPTLATAVASLYLYYASSSGVGWCILLSCAPVWFCRSGEALLPCLAPLVQFRHSPSRFLWGPLSIIQHGWPVFSFHGFPGFICPILSPKVLSFSLLFLWVSLPPHSQWRVAHLVLAVVFTLCTPCAHSPSWGAPHSTPAGATYKAESPDHFMPSRMAFIRQSELRKISVDEDVEKLEPLHIACTNECKWFSCLENSLVFCH